VQSEDRKRLAAMIELWTSDNPVFHGQYVDFEDIAFAPKPVQRPHPPVRIACESRATFGYTSTRSRVAPVTTRQSRPPMGSGKNTSASPGDRSSRQRCSATVARFRQAST
jgi:hypothetical protein